MNGRRKPLCPLMEIKFFYVFFEAIFLVLILSPSLSFRRLLKAIWRSASTLIFPEKKNSSIILSGQSTLQALLALNTRIEKESRRKEVTTRGDQDENRGAEIITKAVAMISSQEPAIELKGALEMINRKAASTEVSTVDTMTDIRPSIRIEQRGARRPIPEV